MALVCLVVRGCTAGARGSRLEGVRQVGVIVGAGVGCVQNSCATVSAWSVAASGGHSWLSHTWLCRHDGAFGEGGQGWVQASRWMLCWWCVGATTAGQQCLLLQGWCPAGARSGRANVSFGVQLTLLAQAVHGLAAIDAAAAVPLAGAPAASQRRAEAARVRQGQAGQCRMGAEHVLATGGRRRRRRSGRGHTQPLAVQC